ncbi:MAG: Heptaprenyl diphosphate synthase component [Clostridia bacterium]|jgi:heptaprenyl diphosphate synthase|nr:Heptaprenyl diphosphate synthase component [Clostridia bacterium]
MKNTKKMVILSLLISQALVLHVIERMIPVPIPVPGIKLGLANVISLFTIILFGWKEALLVVFLRTLLASFFGGGFSAFAYSIAGGFLSALMMSLLYKNFRNTFSIIAISVVGAVFHNIGQVLVASLAVSNVNIFFYLPVLLISGVITGIFIGVAVQYTMKPLSTILKIDRM